MGDARCRHCGAAVEPTSARLYCGHCGARVADGVSDLQAYRTSPERFARVAIEPGYQAALQHAPALSVLREAGWPVLRLGAVLCGLGGLLWRGETTTDPKLLLVVAAVGLFWLWRAGRAAVFGVRRVAARTERVVAVVVVDQYCGHHHRDPVGTCGHLVTLREQGGRAREVFATGALMGEVAIGDVGVAFLRADRLVDYRWFDVMAPPLEPGEPPRPSRCGACGALPRFGPVREQCAFCGQALPSPDLGEFGARFRAAASSPVARAACARRVSGGVPSLWQPLGLCVVGAGLGWFGWQVRDFAVAAIAWSPWFLVVLAVPLGPLLVGGAWLWRRSAPHRAKRQHQLAVVVRKRAELVRTTQNDREVWRHFATVAAPSGARRELEVLPGLHARLERGQLGVAHLRGEWLADFTVLD